MKNDDTTGCRIRGSGTCDYPVEGSHQLCAYPGKVCPIYWAVANEKEREKMAKGEWRETMTKKLGPCPLCGGEAYLFEDYVTEHAAVDRIGCKDGGCKMPDLLPDVWDQLSAISADAKLGRLVRKLPEGGELRRTEQFNVTAPPHWWSTCRCNPRCPGGMAGYGDTPEEALYKAMGEGK